MGMLAIAEEFARVIDGVASEADLGDALADVCRTMGFAYFALTHHVDIRRAPDTTIRIHNYPSRWADYFDDNSLGPSDPVHRASHLTSVGFAWADVPRMIRLTPADLAVLERARDEGIGDGFTVPAHVPGEANGSCSFATAAGTAAPAAFFPLAQLAGAFAFEGARRLWRMREPPDVAPPFLTDRQRDCVLWVARGKGDWEIAQILGISHETVIMHLKQARERYGLPKRAPLVVRTLFDGTISFGDVFKR